MLRIGYLTEWSVYRSTFSSLQQIVKEGKYTHIIYAFAIADPEFGLKFSDEYAANEKGLLRDLMALKAELNIQVGISLGGWNHRSMFDALPPDFAHRVAVFVEKHGFDFVDIDWEFESALEASKRRDALHQLVFMLRKQNVRSTMALQCNRAIIEALCIPDFIESIDYFIVMGYDLAGTWSPASTHHCNLHGEGASISSVMDWMRQQVPLGQICLAVSSFAKVFHGTKGLGHPFESCETLLTRDVDAHGYSNLWDPDCEASTLGGDNRLVSMECDRSLDSKRRYLIQRGLAGLGVWDIEAFTFYRT